MIKREKVDVGSLTLENQYTRIREAAFGGGLSTRRAYTFSNPAFRQGLRAPAVGMLSLGRMFFGED